MFEEAITQVKQYIVKQEQAEKVKQEKQNREKSIEDLISDYCKEYDVPYEIAIAIAKLETGHFTSSAYTHGNNCGGLSIAEKPIEYESKEKGAEAFVKNLAKNYVACGLITPEQIGAKYCPANYESWVRQVQMLISEQ